MKKEIWNPRDWSTQPKLIHSGYKSTKLRNPKNPLSRVNLGDYTKGPYFLPSDIRELDADLTKNGRKTADPIGERMIVMGHVKDEFCRPVKGCLIEIWQANSAGRYIHKDEVHDAPLDPNFFGAGMTLTDEEGFYKFTTIKPGAYPWGNHENAWRPAHIHFSILGRGFVDRLVTQMYFEGDPLLHYDPIFHSIPDEDSRSRLVAKFSMENTLPNFAHAYLFDIVLRGRHSTPMESSS